MFPGEKLLRKTSPFLAISAMMLATLAVQEDCGINRLANTWSIPLPWIFSLVSISERDTYKELQWTSSTLTMTITSTVNSLRIVTIYSRNYLFILKCIYIKLSSGPQATFIMGFSLCETLFNTISCKPTARLQRNPFWIYHLHTTLTFQCYFQSCLFRVGMLYFLLPFWVS